MSMTKPRQTLAQQVADTIAREIGTRQSGLLPAMRILCERYGVSRPTLVEAGKILKERGLVEVSPGRRMRIAGSSADDFPLVREECLSAAERFARFLAKRIEDGTYRAGEDLPKQSYFAANRGVSMRTVRKAYRELARRGLMHRRGRGWVVGAEKGRAQIAVGYRRSIIVIGLRKKYDWQGLHNSHSTRRFVESFETEAEKFGVEMIEAVFDQAAGDFILPAFAARPRTLTSVSRDLGSRYLGVLVPNNRRELPCIGAALDGCVGLGKPTVWFDRSDVDLELPLSGKRYARCHYSEAAVVSTALSTLSELGHRVLGYIHPAGPERWAEVRGARLAGRGAGMKPPVRVVRIPLVQGEEDPEIDAALARDLDMLPEWLPVLAGHFRELIAAGGRRAKLESAGMGAALVPLIRAIARRGGGGWFQGELDTYARLARITPIMLDVLKRPGLTAMLVSRDTYALRCVQWLEAAGIRIPEEMSILSFDNMFGRRPRNLASVDPGLGYLGYAAFHFIFGDVNPRRDDQGNIRARPRISRWATLGAPRRGPVHPSGRLAAAVL